VEPLHWQGLVYRAHHPGWAWAPDSGEGARLHGGRFNRPGLPALYTALRPETAWLEAQAGFAFKAQPMTLCAYRVDCDGVLDLTDPRHLAACGIAAADLAAPWADLADRGEPVPSWAIADRLVAAGAAAVIVPSFAPGSLEGRDVNMVFWRWGPDPPCRVAVIDDHGRLPRDARSWA
jgi:RES domain-containing protein